MTTAVTICSNALLELGADPINSFTETKHARMCQNLYPSLRDDLLRSHYWKCATRRTILSPLEERPDWGWRYAFKLPGDWLRTVQVGENRRPDPYEQEGMNLLLDTNICRLKYVWRNETEASWTRNLVRVAEVSMAARVAYAVTKSTTVRDSKLQEAAYELKIAKAIDGQDNPPEEFDAGTLIESRY
ncbi:hypothetical protein [Burkholderia stagnalis]|uniref:hypothetical protein n=1 Tax=Burkholderia stagnalis TaxID=1503054 RepID=UPI000751F346|nr:hypothetical protein [Burkholderia stagnalis]KVC52335.1 hypothetical protein WS59_33295 [Burkholderia stagnalis]KVN17488.1 hypothetical protein WT10_03500 [Burkholderia stagnalis]KVO56577.1 hypothetical protein WT18_20300 [Burkholderia stagnalis]KVP13890.1 hypothetical protein WT20_07135 [Burkholderia stagnalis]KVW93852.1 hypothetical protein WT30_18895 [Burkholderia stagnalis]